MNIGRPGRDYRREARNACGREFSATAKYGRCWFGPRSAQACVRSDDLRELCRNDHRNVDDAACASAAATNACASAATGPKRHKGPAPASTTQSAAATTDGPGNPAKALSLYATTRSTIAGFAFCIRIIWKFVNAEYRQGSAMACKGILQREPCGNSEMGHSADVTNT